MSQQIPSYPTPPQPAPQPAPAKKHSKLAKVGGPLVAALIIFGVGHCAGSSDAATSATVTATSTVTATQAGGGATATKTITATKTVTAKAPVQGGGGSTVTTISDDGTYKAGEDIAAGEWKATVPDDSVNCYWQVSTDSNGNNILSNNNTNAGGHVRVTIPKGRYFATQGCGTWTRIGS